MSNKPTDEEVVVATLLCPLCEADLWPGAVVCLRCGSSAHATPTEPAKVHKAPAAREFKEVIAARSNQLLTLVSIVLVVGLIGVLVAVANKSVGLAIAFVLLTVPPLVRTSLVVLRRTREGIETGRAATIAMFFGSSMVTLLMVCVTLVSCVLSFCFVCLAVASAANSTGGKSVKDLNEILLPTSIITIAISVGLVLLMFSPWIIHRWKRDTREKQW